MLNDNFLRFLNVFVIGTNFFTSRYCARRHLEQYVYVWFAEHEIELRNKIMTGVCEDSLFLKT